MTRQRCLRCHEECDRRFCENFHVRDGEDGLPRCKMQQEVRRMRQLGWSPAVISGILGLSLEAVLRWLS